MNDLNREMVGKEMESMWRCTKKNKMSSAQKNFPLRFCLTLFHTVVTRVAKIQSHFIAWPCGFSLN